MATDPYLDRIEAKGRSEGKKEGENLLASLMQKLFALGRDEDVKRIASDEAFRKELYKEFNLA